MVLESESDTKRDPSTLKVRIIPNEFTTFSVRVLGH